MGPPQAEAALRECLSLGADDAVLITDRALAVLIHWRQAIQLPLPFVIFNAP